MDYLWKPQAISFKRKLLGKISWMKKVSIKYHAIVENDPREFVENVGWIPGWKKGKLFTPRKTRSHSRLK